ncbi:hypothetical protein GTQ99_16435, partial [Kineococcus sp. T13]|uniref:helix-turn-helix transcriptional regulator n=1 Tax=Kineococcus vitellinus TaxID=2696565 RepID=UPI0014136691
GDAPDPAAGRGPAATAEALVALVGSRAAGRGVLVSVDDVDQADEASLHVLAALAAAVGRTGAPLLLTATATAGVPAARPGPLEVLGPGATTVVRLERLLPQHVREVLDDLGVPAGAAARAPLVQPAAGNPLALGELAASARGGGVGRDGEAGQPGGSASPRLSVRAREAFADGLDTLPAPTRAALVTAALALETRSGRARAAVLASRPPQVWEPAVAAGVLVHRGGGLRFAHPLTAVAVLEGTTAAQRRTGHRRVAEALPAGDPARAWHLARAGSGPDPALADRLEEAAHRLAGLAAPRAAAHALVLAAARSAAQDRARRLLLAARHARSAGDPGEAERLEALCAGGREPGGAASGRRTEDVVLRAVGEAWVSWTAPAIARARELLGPGTPDEPGCPADPGNGRNSGNPETREALQAPETPGTPRNPGRAAGPGGGARSGSTADAAQAVVRAWGRALLDPASRPGLVGAAVRGGDDWLEPLRGSALSPDGARGALALVVDESARAAASFTRALESAPHAVAAGGTGVRELLTIALLDAGRWQEAGEQVARCLHDAPGRALVATLVSRAVLALLRGEHEQPLHVLAALQSLPPATSALHEARLLRARGLAASAVGEHRSAVRHLRRLHGPDAAALHPLVSDPALADVVSAHLAVGDGQRARALLAAVQARGVLPSVRRELVLHRARALVAADAGADAEAERHFRRALAAPGARWPFERALVQLELAERLRRRQRPTDARPLLRSALRAFTDLGAEPWVQRTRAELTAAGDACAGSGAGGAATAATGADVRPAQEATAAPAGLTPRQWQVAALAAQGLTNPQIADRLRISHRTVSAHLQHAFRALGTSRRAQLGPALEAARNR